MSKNNEKWINFGTSTGQVNSRSLPAHFTPTNYSPSQVDSEGTDKVSAHLKGIDSKLSIVGSFGDDDFDVGAGGQTEFTSSYDITASNVVDVFVNGQLQREGASHDYTRDANLDKVVFNSAIPENAWVRVRVHT